LDSQRRRFIPFLRFTDEEDARLRRWARWTGWVFLFMLLLLIPVVRSGYFREQARLKQARSLVETGGYAYCAIWGDGTDPFQLMARNSPLLPRWQGERQSDGDYMMTFTYRRSGKQYRHQWEVDLEGKRVYPAGDMSVPQPKGTNEMQCSERR
jgi:hypothetical protein